MRCLVVADRDCTYSFTRQLHGNHRASNVERVAGEDSSTLESSSIFVQIVVVKNMSLGRQRRDNAFQINPGCPRIGPCVSACIQRTGSSKDCAVQSLLGATDSRTEALVELELRAFSSEVDTGSREENASNKDLEPRF